jgi:hypothetical protein
VTSPADTSRSTLYSAINKFAQSLTELNDSGNLLVIIFPHYSSETIHKYYYGERFKDDVTWVSRLEMHGAFSLKSLKGLGHLGDLGVEGG